MYQRIVVPLDGSELGEQALPHAEELARQNGAPLHLVRVVEPPGSEGGIGLTMYAATGVAAPAMEDDAEAYLDRVGQALTKRGVIATTELLHGRAAPAVVAASRPGDVIVVATHGHTGLTRWYLGSVAEELVRHAPVPVLLVRAQPRSA
jgi:nucleotide-binding universal stress UspA family protein